MTFSVIYISSHESGPSEDETDDNYIREEDPSLVIQPIFVSTAYGTFIDQSWDINNLHFVAKYTYIYSMPLKRGSYAFDIWL